MHTSIEYIFAGIAIFLILGVTSQYATNLVNNSANLIEKEGGAERADKIIDMLLLSPGSPQQWGGQFEPTTMGLALRNALKMYQLDFSKVKRLSSNATNYIAPNRVRDLLGLSDYTRISLRVYPLLNITVTNVTGESFSVRVLNQWNLSVSNINITAAYCYTPVDSLTRGNITAFMDYSLDDSSYASNITNTFGTCTLSFTGNGTRPTLIVLASRLDVKCLTTWPSPVDCVVGSIESSMGSSSAVYNTEIVYRTVEIDGFNYVARLAVWG